jgi:UDP-GlcNAc:undecaprenyl-phosphate/decaprenyl-phosphate GlcNAc-1-phosphate transferase
VTSLVIPIIRYFALKLAIVDQRSKRKLHNRIITRFGGLGIYIGFVFAMANAFIFSSLLGHQDFLDYIVVIMASTLILILGVFDDAKGANAIIKFTVQILAAFIITQAGFAISIISNPFGQPIELGIFSIPLTILWLVGITNAINLIDGMDGLAAGIIFIVCCSMAYMFISSGLIMPAFFAVALAGACLGFLRFNFTPARIFMGDTGSLFLGFSIAALAILTHRKGHATIGLFLPAVICLGIPIYDTALAFIRRVFINKTNPFQADNEHIHHILLRLHLKQKNVVLTLWALTVILNVVAIVIYNYSVH